MGLRTAVIDTLFGGRADPLATILKKTKGSSTSPNGITTAPIGTFMVMDYNGDNSDDDVYMNTDGSTAWALVYNAVTQGHLY